MAWMNGPTSSNFPPILIGPAGQQTPNFRMDVHMSSDETRALLVEAANRAANYIEGLRLRDVPPLRGSVERLIGVLNSPLPDDPSKPTDVLALLDDYGSPATVASAGGRYFGFVTGGAMPVTVAAQYLAAGWDQNCFSFISSPAMACIESAA